MDRIPPQPTVMVTGSDGRHLRSVATELLQERSAAGDGAVVVTTRESSTALVRRLTTDRAGFDPERLAVVDARTSAADDPAAGLCTAVAADASPATLDDAVTEGLDWLAAGDVERRHVLYDTLERDDWMPDEEAAYERAYRIAMTVGAEDGLALFALDVEGLSASVVEKLSHLFDVHVALRDDDGDTELQWTGLLGASEGWVPVAEADLGVGGFR